ncbi:hypothetical protein PHMEG_00035326, partial [Phytophthora megakarya]
PEEFFDRALAEAEDDDWELGLAEGVNPWPSVPLKPRDSTSPSEEEEEASGNERDGNEPDDETSLGKRSRPKSKTPAGKRPKRLAPLTPSPGKSNSSRTPREKTAPALSDVSSDDENAPREPARLYWGSSCPEERIAESVSPAVWGTCVTVHANRFPVPEPEEYVMPRGRR